MIISVVPSEQTTGLEMGAIEIGHSRRSSSALIVEASIIAKTPKAFDRN
jgi:hypothetical protein